MNIERKKYLSINEKEAVFHLWNNEYPVQIQLDAIENLEMYLNSLNELIHYLVKDENSNLLGWAIEFMRENQKWFAIIISRNAQNTGIGSKLLHELKSKNTTLTGWVVKTDKYVKKDYTQYNSPIPFYLKNDFSILLKDQMITPIMTTVKIFWSNHKKS
ncbi:MAG: GNAT family N-acetyltransferase [Flavobacteriia bacterium]|nr:GNAT family N-acetyltransferase [Flavobacteriia bacterium]